MKIAKADASDVDALEVLINSAYRGESSKQGWTTEADLLDGIRTCADELKKIIGTSGSQILKCLNRENCIIGCVHVEQRGEELHVGMLTVAPALQNQGIGKLLLAACEAEAKRLGSHSISMQVISLRSELIAWYERHGYINTGIKKPFPMDDPAFGLPKQFLEFVVLRKAL